MKSISSSTKRIVLSGAFALAGCVTATTALADSKTVINSTPGKYTETRKGDGEQYKYQTDGVRSSEAYEGDGVQMKAKSDGVTTKQVYKDGDCQKKSVDNAATGNTKVVAEGNCAP